MTFLSGGDGLGNWALGGAVITSTAGGGGVGIAALGGGRRSGFCVGDEPMRVCSSSRTESFIIAPQVKQIDNVGASVRLQTGQFIRQKDSIFRGSICERFG